MNTVPIQNAASTNPALFEESYRVFKNIAREAAQEVAREQEDFNSYMPPVEKLITISKFCSLTGASQDFIREKCWCTDPKLHPFPCIKRKGKTGNVNIRLYLSLGLRWLEDEMTGAWKKKGNK